MAEVLLRDIKTKTAVQELRTFKLSKQIWAQDNGHKIKRLKIGDTQQTLGLITCEDLFCFWVVVEIYLMNT